MKKQHKILINYVLGPLLFIILAISIYFKVKTQSDLEEKTNLIKNAFAGGNITLIALLVFLMVCNWGIESRKWQLLMRPIQHVSFLRAFRAVLSGLSFSLFIPNGIGEYFGRIVYMDEGNRLKSISLTIAGSMSQVIITALAGIISLFYLKENAWQHAPLIQGLPIFWINIVFSMIIMGAFVLIMVYYRLSLLSRLFEKIPLVHKYRYFIEHLETFSTKDLTKILGLSLIRFSVFTAQYIVALNIFKAGIALPEAIATVSVIFLVLLVLPTIPAADLGLRGQTALQLFGLISTNAVAIVATTAAIWFVNLILPAMAGSLFVSGIRIFKK